MSAADPYEAAEEAIRSRLDQSLHPRGPEMLYQHVASADIGPESTLLDLGCNMGKHSFELHRRFGCHVVGVDIDAYYIERAVALLASHPRLQDAVMFRVGSADAIPADDNSFDLVWCRDVLELVDNLARTYREINRVLKPSGRAVIYTMCATDLMEPQEAGRLYAGLSGIKALSMLSANHEEAIAGAGLKVVETDMLGPEWGEFDQEHTGKPAKCLLRVARLLRSRAAFVREFGEANYEVAIADRLWHVYRMIGKLAGHIYVLEKVADPST